MVLQPSSQSTIKISFGFWTYEISNLKPSPQLLLSEGYNPLMHVLLI
jgi:hypothetical protein